MNRYKLPSEWQRIDYYKHQLFTPMYYGYNHGLSYGRFKHNSEFHEFVYTKAAKSLDLVIRYLRLLEKNDHVKILKAWNTRMEAGCVVYICLTNEGYNKSHRFNNLNLATGIYDVSSHFNAISYFNEAALEMDIKDYQASQRIYQWERYKNLTLKAVFQNLARVITGLGNYLINLYYENFGRNKQIIQ